MQALQTLGCRIHGKKDLRIEQVALDELAEGKVLIKVGAVGICGSDIHYFHDGGIGTAIRVQEPIVPGHEFSGTVEAIGAGVTNVKAGDKVAINPSQPCGICEYCQKSIFQQCLNMQFMGSAMRLPHCHGGARERLVVSANQCYKIGNVSLGEAACCEPLSVGLHAINRSGGVIGKTVLLTGCGPIGALCIAAIKHAGAKYIIACDIEDNTLKVAKQMGADETINTLTNFEAVQKWKKDKGQVDMVFECSGANVAINLALDVVRPLGTVVQIGNGGNITVAINTVLAKEINWLGSTRFHKEFAKAAEYISSREIDVRPVITAAYPLNEALTAFNVAADRKNNIKVQLVFN